MLTKTLQQEYNTQSYRFTQIPELVQCLLVRGTRTLPRGVGTSGRASQPCRAPSLPNQCILQKEPNFLASPFRPKIILVVVGLR